SAAGRPPETGRWLRGCLAGPRCREDAAALLAASLARHGRALWGGLLVGVASAAWLGVLRVRSLRPRRSVGDARFASRAEVRALDCKCGEAGSRARAAQEWRRRARDVQVFAPLEATTLRWNPLAGCRSIGDAQQLASQLFEDPDPSDADMVYWVGAERHICAVLCCALGADGGPATLGRLRTVCESGPAGVQAYVRAHPQAPVLMARLGASFAMLPKDQAGILQGIASRLDEWGDEAGRGATD